jgi:hypothetical protein
MFFQQKKRLSPGLEKSFSTENDLLWLTLL